MGTFELHHPPEVVPLAAIAAATVTDVPLAASPSLAIATTPFLLLPSGEKLHGLNTILRYFAREGNLYGKDSLSAAQVDEWIEYAPSLSIGAAFEKVCLHIDSYLETRTFLVGNSPTVADIAILAGLAGAGQRWESLRKSAKFSHLVRLNNSLLNTYQALTNAFAKHVVKKDSSRADANLNKDGAKAIEKVEGSFEIDLPDAEMGKVCTRFPPEPSGYLHIGHAKAALLNQYFANKYQGRLIVRFDDTNPAKENNEFVESILADLDILGVKDDTPWKQMKNERGDERGLQCCLRGKLDMQAVNKSLRDPITDNGKVEGWDDPRFPTVRGILRRGLTVEALKQFILSQGASKNLNLMEWDKLWTINKKIVDPVCPRHTAIVKEGRVLFSLKDGPDQAFIRIIPRHKKWEAAGKKATTFTKQIWLEAADAAAVAEGEEVTLMDWGNAVVETVERDGSGNVVGLEGRLHLEGSVKTSKLKLTWLPDFAELVNLALIDLDHLITKKKLDKKDVDDLISFLNPTTRWEIQALGDANMRNLKRGEIIQLERKGYFVCDSPYIRPSKPIALIAIPDGRQRPTPEHLPQNLDMVYRKA
ncbi:hypothetical protein GOP47_0012214 [Adiantum capillus-veneris]|uniref:glutamate--tRNA ligase n=1 Tax=Adiantum capillus-veneris TaxID=13818 RepID=A0A9D4URM1_ADICA|nr:hypothetical protein GOP47_0012214 [Adiantum capillus-veneris]